MFNGVHACLLPTGKVILWDEVTNTQAYLWDPATSVITTAANPQRRIFCGGNSFLPDGRLLVTGGTITNGDGLPSADIYDPFTDTWAGNVPDMNLGRWYPGQAALANGDILVTSGLYGDPFQRNPLPQVYEVSTNSWRDLTDAQLGIVTYPPAFQAPNGKVFFATGTSRYLDTSGTGSWSVVDSHEVAGRDSYGSAVMYDEGKVLYVGGADPPTATAEIIDLNNPNPQWTLTGSMAQPRRQQNATLLPDGTVLVLGGSSLPGFDNPLGEVLTPEVWNPSTGQFTSMAAASEYRGYHSSAVLLPDARVLVAGGEYSSNAEVFSPAYLFDESGLAARPSIAGAPQRVGWGETFFVETPDGASIADVNWVSMGAATHAKDFNQRINELSFTVVPGGLEVTAPPSGNDAPPGYYMLFLIDDQGVPSIASFVRNVGSDPNFGDFNDDGLVDVEDLNFVLFNWNEPSSDLPTAWSRMRPGAGNFVGVEELNKVLFSWNQSASASAASTFASQAVPEPTTATCFALGTALTLLPRRKGR
jgi:hypothetical protein